jgi:hypothetical protein
VVPAHERNNRQYRLKIDDDCPRRSAGVLRCARAEPFKDSPQYYDLALSYGLDAALKPTRLDISETVRWLGYKPGYSLANLLSELAEFGDGGPPHFTRN